jgi:transcriptional regulator with XRE-family HTH domain
MLDCSKSTVSMIENGERSPSIELFVDIANVFNTTLDSFFSEVNENLITNYEQSTEELITIISKAKSLASLVASNNPAFTNANDLWLELDKYIKKSRYQNPQTSAQIKQIAFAQFSLVE